MLPVVIYSTKRFYLLEALNEKIEIFKSAGLIDVWHYQDVDKDFIKVRIVEAPKVLSLHQLVGSFQLLGSGYAIALVAFIREKLMKRFNRAIEH